MENFKIKVQDVIDRYKDQLSEKGIKIMISKRYFEADVQERSGNPSAGMQIFNIIDRTIDRKKEHKHGYNYQKNKYHCVTLTVSPIEKNTLQREECRDYTFVLKKVERAHIGEKPQRITYEENKILSKIEKYILKILNKTEKFSVKKICKNTLLDAIRYSFCIKYEYKKKFLGKERFTWDMIFMFATILLAVAIITIAWSISNFLVI